MLDVLYADNQNSKNNKRNKTEDDLELLVDATETELFRCRSIFPFTLFPDEIIVDKNKIDIVYANFFFSKSVFTLLIEDLRTVKVSSSPFFATMKFEVIGYEQNPEPVRYLPKTSAFKARRIILGLATAKRENISLDDKDNSEMLAKLEKIGDAQRELLGI